MEDDLTEEEFRVFIQALRKELLIDEMKKWGEKEFRNGNIYAWVVTVFNSADKNKSLPPCDQTPLFIPDLGFSFHRS